MTNSIIKFMELHPECNWSIRRATQKEMKMGGQGQDIDFVYESDNIRLFMDDKEYLEVFAWLVEKVP